MPLTGEQAKSLRRGLQKAFLNTANLGIFLQEQLERPIANYVAMADPLPNAAFNIIQYAEAEAWIDDLVVAAVTTRPKQPDIVQVATELGLTGGGANLSNRRVVGPSPQQGPADHLESIIRGKKRFIDVEAFLSRATTLQAQVCRIEAKYPDGDGTGFLVGTDKVLTNFHVMEPVLNRDVPEDDVVFRFDYREMADGTKARDGTEFRLNRGDWVVEKSSYSQRDLVVGEGEPADDELDFCLVRLDEAAGDGKAGGSEDPNADDRGWIALEDIDRSGANGDDVFILQHPEGNPMKIAIGEHLGFNGAGNRLRYDADTMPGSSGSPVFNRNLEIIGLHHRGDPKANVVRMTAEHNQGIPIKRIVNHLRDRGVEGFAGG